MAEQSKINKTNQMRAVYDKVAEFFNTEYENTSALIDDFLRLIKKNGKILDVGCGTGKDTGYMSDKGFEVLGIDISKNMIRFAKNNASKAKFKVMDMTNLKFNNALFDGIFIAFSLIHLSKSKVDKILNKLYALLKDDGIIYFAIQEGKSNEGIILSPYENKDKIFLNVFSKKEFLSLIDKAGFAPIKDYERKPKKNEFQYNKYFVLAKKV